MATWHISKDGNVVAKGTASDPDTAMRAAKVTLWGIVESSPFSPEAAARIHAGLQTMHATQTKGSITDLLETEWRREAALYTIETASEKEYA